MTRKRSGAAIEASSEYEVGVTAPDWLNESLQLRRRGRIVGVHEDEHVRGGDLAGQGYDAALTGAPIPDAGLGYRECSERAGDLGRVVRGAIVHYDHPIDFFPGQLAQGHGKALRFVAGRYEDGDFHREAVSR